MPQRGILAINRGATRPVFSHCALLFNLRCVRPMKVLALLRHAKAVKDDPGGDHARALTPAGRDAAASAGHRLAPYLVEGFLAVASDARRTRDTAQLAFPALVEALQLEPGAYAADPKALLGLIRELPEDAPGAILVGHNPGLSALAVLLAARGEPRDLARIGEGLATADAVVFEMPDGWRETAPGTGRVMAFLQRTERTVPRRS